MLRRTALALAVATLAAAPLVPAPPAHAATALEARSSTIFNYLIGQCASNTSDTADSPVTAIAFDGVPRTTSLNSTATLTKKTGDTGDQVNLAAATQATVLGRATTGGPTSLDVDATVTTTVSSTRANSACSAWALGASRTSGTIDLATPMLVTVSVDADTGVRTQTRAGTLRVDTVQLTGHQEATTLAPAGALPVQVEISHQHSQPPAPLPATWTGHAKVHITLTVPGSLAVPPAGKAAPYVALPAARSCAGHNATASVVAAKKKAKKIRLLTYKVDGITVAKLKHPKPGAASTLSLPDAAAPELTAVVQLVPRKKGGKGKVYEVSASYSACSG